MSDWKTDSRPMRLGWAPGGYLGECCICKGRFIGDKRAVMCADCAYSRPEPAPISPEAREAAMEEISDSKNENVQIGTYVQAAITRALAAQTEELAGSPKRQVDSDSTELSAHRRSYTMIEHSNPHKKGGYKHPHQKDGEVPYEASAPMSGVSPEAREAAEVVSEWMSDNFCGVLNETQIEYASKEVARCALAAQTEELALLRETVKSICDLFTDSTPENISMVVGAYVRTIQGVKDRLLAENERLTRERDEAVEEKDRVARLANKVEEVDRLRNCELEARIATLEQELSEKTDAIQEAAKLIDRFRNQARRENERALQWEENHNAAQRRIATLEQQAREKEESASTQLKCKLAEYRRRTALREAMGRVLTILEEVESVPSGERTAKGKSAISAARVEIDRAFKADSVPFAATAATNEGGSEG